MASYNKSMCFILFTLLLSSICFISVEPSNNGGITVNFIHRDSTHSPSYDPSHTHFQRLRQAIDRSFSRKSWLASSTLSSPSLSSSSTESVDAPIRSAGGEYLMKINIGTPPVEQLLIADTGSDLLWMQCKPCTNCYKQNIPLFDPSRTSTYRPVSCQSDKCEAAGNAQCDSNNSCQYQVQYGDRSYSFGEIAAETIGFDGGMSFQKVAFGCGHENAGTFSPAGAGIIGLGGGAISIINQLDSAIGGKFSYCLTLLNFNASSKISFGSNAVVAGPNVVSTPLIKKAPPTFYYLTLEGISIGGERVDYMSSSKALGDDAEGNIIIDSGTTLTFVPSEMYDAVEAELEKVIKGTRVSDSRGTFKMCYQIESGSGPSSPPITAHFRGADVVLPQESVFLEVEQGIACLTLVPSQDLAIFGNLHQMNYKVGYDTVSKKVSFLPTDCSKSE